MRPQSGPIVSAGTLEAIPPGGFAKVKVLVVGDLMLDQYIDGEVHRISPEAPVPVLSVKKRRFVPGGAANVALNVLGLQAEVVLAGVVGIDASGHRLMDLLKQAGCDLSSVTTVASRPTTSKTRIVSGNHQIVRLDEEVAETLDQQLELDLLGRVVSCLTAGGIDAVVLSDYDKGVLSGSCPQLIIEECRRRSIPVLADPKRQDYVAYRGATCVTPNQKEFFAALAVLGINPADFYSAGSALREHLNCSALLVTQGADGMTLLTDGKAQHLPALAEEVFDVSGAGDTVIATFAVALGSGLTLEQAVEVANAAASIVVRRVGTFPVLWNDLSALLNIGLLYSPDSASRLPGDSQSQLDRREQ